MIAPLPVRREPANSRAPGSGPGAVSGREPRVPDRGGRRGSGWFPVVLALVVSVTLPADPAAAQVTADPPVQVTEPGDTVVVQAEAEGVVSPGGAFLRSLVVPGWGHVVTGAENRGAFYVAAQSASAWMLLKSISKRREARRFRDMEFEAAGARIGASGLVPSDSVRVRAERDARVEQWDETVEARGQQVEDWAALGVFLVLLGATDAFVAGHLMDRPEPLSLDVRPGARGGWELRLEVSPRRKPAR
jgi:hypothetical protein